MAGKESIGELISHNLQFACVFKISIGNLTIPVSETVVVSWGVMAFLMLGSVLLTRRLDTIPGRIQGLLEWFVGFINDFSKQHLGKHWWNYAPYLGTLGLFIFCSSIVGIVSPTPAFGIEPPFLIKPPVRDINVTAALACLTMVIVMIGYFRHRGLLGWLKSLLHPVPMMLPFNILEYAIKPVSLTLRLFGNTLGGFIIMELVTLSVPLFVPPVASLYFDLIDGLIQSVIFVMLTTIYVSEVYAEHG